MILYTLLKSEVGPFPMAEFPQGIDLRLEERKARRRLYPVTVIYTVYFAALIVASVLAQRTALALAWVAAGVLAWIPIEYLVHRHLLHGVFPRGKGLVSRSMHYLFDSSHSDHHARPWDGNHINGHLDTVFVAIVAFPLSFLAPHYTVPMFVATVFTCFLVEEWTHHAIHFWNFRWQYFQYIRRRHLYHHSRHGVGVAYGITSGVMDAVIGTRLSAEQRRRLARWSVTEPGRATAPALTEEGA
jgi:hypothetical protein